MYCISLVRQAEDVSTVVNDHAAKKPKTGSEHASVAHSDTAGTAASTVEVMLSTYT